MIPVRKLRDLTVGSSDTSDPPPHVSAASSLVRHEGQIYVVADDEYSLLTFPIEGEEPGHFMRILDGQGGGQKDKPDLESLALLPRWGEWRQGCLLALGSGSSEARNRGALIVLGDGARPTEEHLAIDLLPLYERLADEVKGLNIEGAEVVDDTLWLMQRGNEEGDNALINLELSKVMQALKDDRTLPADSLRAVDHVDLGQLQGVRLCFSDASALPDGRVVFAASTEESDSDAPDGQVYGSALGVIDREGSVSFVEPVDMIIKIEGIDARHRGNEIEVLMVTDADDPEQPSPLLEALIPD